MDVRPAAADTEVLAVEMTSAELVAAINASLGLTGDPKLVSILHKPFEDRVTVYVARAK